MKDIFNLKGDSEINRSRSKSKNQSTRISRHSEVSSEASKEMEKEGGIKRSRRQETQQFEVSSEASKYSEVSSEVSSSKEMGETKRSRSRSQPKNNIIIPKQTEQSAEAAIKSFHIEMIPFTELKLQRNKIGQGRISKVYLGYWKEKEKVAIKKVYLKDLPRLSTEETKKVVEIYRNGECSNIIHLYGVSIRDKDCFIVLEPLNRGTLFNLLKDPTVSLLWNPHRWNIAIDICRGLNYLHSKDILHRDLKSSNVLINDSFKAKLKLSLESTNDISARKVSNRWRAPELLCQNTVPNKSSDIYSFGMVLWEIASRKIPFEDTSDDMVAQDITAGKI